MCANKIYLKRGKDLQELCETVLDYVKRGKGNHRYGVLAMRFDFEADLAGEWEEAPIESYVYSLVVEMNDRKQLFEFLDYLVDVDKANHPRYNIILRKHGFTIEEFQGKYHLATLTGKIFEEETKEVQAFIEQHASKKTLNCLKKAKDNFAKNDFRETLSQCRNALESLTKNSIRNGIKELIKENVIGEGTEARKEDVWILKAIHGFNSTLGAHNSANNPEADEEQAFMGMMITQTCIHFLLKKIQQARKGGKSLQEWV